MRPTTDAIVFIPTILHLQARHILAESYKVSGSHKPVSFGRANYVVSNE